MIKLEDDERLDDLLIENYKIIQNKNLYSFTSDSILLAKFAKVKKKDRVLDLCSGSGIVGIHIMLDKNPKEVVLLELQEKLASLSKKTIEFNNFKNISVVNIPVQGASKVLGCESFDVVVVNPPYAVASSNDVKALSSEELTEKEKSNLLAKTEASLTCRELCCEIFRVLKFAGAAFIVIPASRISEYVYNLEENKLAVKKLKFVFSKDGTARLALIKAVKGANSFCIVEK